MSEDEVIQKARRAELASRAERGIAGQGAIVEIVRELITVVIGALTLVQLLLGLKIIGR